MDNVSISNLQRRQIQAPLVASLLRQFINEFGYERAMQAASAAIQSDAELAGKAMAEQYGGNSIADLVRLVQEVWAAEDALELTVLEQTGQKLSFNVTRCRYAELYDRMGVKEFGPCLSCDRDSALITGFNPRMHLTRTQTIMQGASLCDFRIVVDL
ncbi:MAG: L-2-amino-thiazoline-4-carboxylic acid hydrolase [Anaerolineaceae bacterium]|nr:L-2-amino-thiazoline-4-carboxylic acid hydrolase [Anaerolineaceae bacterium]